MEQEQKITPLVLVMQLKQCQTLKNMRQNCEYSMELIIHIKVNTALVPGEKSGVFFFLVNVA